MTQMNLSMKQKQTNEVKNRCVVAKEQEIGEGVGKLELADANCLSYIEW